MDSSWVTWAIQGITALAIGALGYFLKRTLVQLENRIDKQEQRVDKLEAAHNDLKNRLPLEYTRQEEFLRSIARIDNKLDKIHDTLLRQGGASQ